MEMTVMSYMAVMPVPITEKIWVQGKAPGGHAHDQAQHSADGQDQEHVDAGHGPHQDHQIGQDLPDAVCADLRLGRCRPR